jgi:hypothetical protein
MHGRVGLLYGMCDLGSRDRCRRLRILLPLLHQECEVVLPGTCTIGYHMAKAYLDLQVGLKAPHTLPDKADILYRYDPAVLIIYVRWHETRQSFGKLLRDLLYLSYAGNEDSVRGPRPVHTVGADSDPGPLRLCSWSVPSTAPLLLIPAAITTTCTSPLAIFRML